MVALDDGIPRTMNLLDTLTCWVNHQIEIVTRRTEHRLERAQHDLHINSGLLKAIGMIDEIISTIRASEDRASARSSLMAEPFEFTEIQTNHILDMQLGRLTRLGRDQIEEKVDELTQAILEYQGILSDEQVLRNIIIDELTEIRDEFSNERRTELVSDPGDFLIEDLIEEIARILGYDQFPTSNISSSIPEYIPNIPLHLREQVRDACVEFGMQEVITYSLKNESLLSSVSSEDSQNFVNIANPLNSETKTLRTNLMVGILETLSSNQNFLKEGPVKIFEIGRTFINKPGSLPIQNEVAVGLISGNSSSEGWTNTKNRKLDFYDIKGILEGVLSKLKLEVKYIPSEDSLLIQGQSADILIEETKIGKVGKISGHILSSFEINETNTLLFELDLNTIYSRSQNKIAFKPFATFPTSERDLTVLAGADIPSEKIESIILASKLATKCIPIDIYKQGSDNQKKSITYKIVFQSTSKTLTANEVSNEIKTILLNLKKTLDVDFRDK